MYNCFQGAGNYDNVKDVTETHPPPLSDRRSKRVSVLLIMSQVFEKLAPFLVSCDNVKSIFHPHV